MAIKCEVKLKDFEVEEYNKAISKEEFKGSVEKTIEYRIKCIVTDVACRTGYHPAGYGIWSEAIIEKEDGELYATWHRSNTCD